MDRSNTMSALEQLATSLGRADELPNIALAERIVSERNVATVRELVDILNGKDKALKSDALKALYEVGYRSPDLIAPFIAQFKNLLANPDNRLVWGAMCAIDGIATIKPDAVYMILPQIMAAVDRGTVITRDHAVKTLAKLAAQERFARTAMPLLLEQLRTAPLNQLPMYAELAAAVVLPQDTATMRAILETRLPELPTEAKKKRVEKALRKLRAA
jgi:hypothetical protein